MDDEPKAEPPKPPTATPAKLKAPDPQRRGLLLVLTLGMLAGIAGCLVVQYMRGQAADIAEEFGMELPVLTLAFFRFSAVAFALPPVVWAGAMAITRFGRTQQNVGKMLALLLFGFAVLWPLAAFVVLQRVYDPPRTHRLQDG